MYGVDEYTLLSFLHLPEIKTRTLYFNFNWIGAMYFSNTLVYGKKTYVHPVYFAIRMLIYIAIRIGLLQSGGTYTILSLFTAIESMRFSNHSMYDIFKTNINMMTVIGMLLSIVPTKYHIGEFLHNYKDKVSDMTAIPKDILHQMMTQFRPNSTVNDIDAFYTSVISTILDYVSCGTQLIVSSAIWCTKPHIFPESDCDTAKYSTGFYDRPNPPVGLLLRNHLDIDQLINILPTRQTILQAYYQPSPRESKLMIKNSP